MILGPVCLSFLSSTDVYLYDLLDYRRIPRTLSHVYYDPLTPENRAEINKIFKALTSDPSDPVQHKRKLTTWGRAITVPESSSSVAKFHFDELCGMPLSAADYLEIVKHFKTIFILDVPKMGLNQKDKARRFITFIDGMRLPTHRGCLVTDMPDSCHSLL